MKDHEMDIRDNYDLDKDSYENSEYDDEESSKDYKT